MEIVIYAKMLVKNGDRLLILASTDSSGATEYDLPGGVINSSTDIKSSLNKNLNRIIKARANDFRFLTKTSEETLEGENVITLYYACEISKGVLELSSEYDSYYWFEIEDICAQPVLPIWIKGAALFLEGTKKTDKIKVEGFRQRAETICESLGSKAQVKANGEHTYKTNNKIFCSIDDNLVSLLANGYDYQIIQNIEGIKIADKKGQQWIKIPLEANIEDDVMFNLIKDSYEQAK